MMDPERPETQTLLARVVEDITACESADPPGAPGGAIAAGDPAEPSLQKICMTTKESTSVVEDLRNNKRVALSGKPGYGRLFAAQELAYALIGRENPAQVAIAQFDETYTFAQFLGMPPIEDNFLFARGLFVKLCMQAQQHPENSYVYVINETDPGKVDRIFTQFAAVMEDGSAAPVLHLLYGLDELTVPGNLYVLALLAVTGDQKTPESFSPHPLQASMHLEELQKQTDVPRLEELHSVLRIVEGINRTVSAEPALGPKYCLEQNFMCPCALSGGDDVLAFEVKRDLSPLMTEYCTACINSFIGK